MIGTTLAHAELTSKLVLTRHPLRTLGRIRGWCGVDADLDSIGARSELGVDGATSGWLLGTTTDFEAEFADPGVVGHGDLHGTVEGGGLRSRVRADRDGVECAGTVVVVDAETKLVAEVDWVEIGLLKGSSECLDSDDATGHITDGAFGLGGELATKLGAATDDAGVEDVVEQNLDGLASQGGAGAAEGALAGLDLVASVVPGEGRGDTRNAGERDGGLLFDRSGEGDRHGEIGRAHV